MTEDELIRWSTLVVAQARGSKLTPAARAERRQLEREQPELASEAPLWAEFAQFEQPRALEQSDEAMVEAVLARAVVRVEPVREASRPQRSIRGAATLLFALAACVLLGLVLGELRGVGAEAIDQAPNDPLGEASMIAERDDELHVATPGEHRLARGDCRRTRSGATLCTRERVQFQIDAQPSAPGLELEDGQLQVDATIAETPIDISTPAGVVRTHGSIELRFDPITAKLDIHVISGEAELLRSEITPVRLGVGATMSLLAEPTHALAEPPVEVEAAPDLAREPAPASPSVPKPPPTADELLAAAQRALAQGESAKAIERYQTLIAEYPESGAANIGSVSLGRLLLRRGRASEALAAFEHYLDSGAHELIEVARHGRILALRELGRTAEANSAIAEFLAAHPGSIHRETLEAWQHP